jgi:hypothetical protein
MMKKNAMQKTLMIRSILCVKVINVVNYNNLKQKILKILIVVYNFMQMISSYYLSLLYIYIIKK